MRNLMNHRLILSALALSAFSVFASGCPVQIPNILMCRDKGRMGAVCAYWMKPEETKVNIPLHEWNDKRFGMICTSESGFGNMKAVIEKLCQTHQCVEQADKLVKALK